MFGYPKQAYFPPISQPEGLPLKVQDARGKEWVFQFRFWPNNNSRMYVLEGVTPCIQSMQLQAGDTGNFMEGSVCVCVRTCVRVVVVMGGWGVVNREEKWNKK